MDKSRYITLVNDEDALTPEELAAGWHFCPEFDGLLTQGENRDPSAPCLCGNKPTPIMGGIGGGEAAPPPPQATH